MRMGRKLKSLDRAFLRMYKEDSLREQGGRCVYCLDQMTYKASTTEHKIPKSKGGSNKKDNIGASCQRCNRDKGALIHKDYVTILSLSIPSIGNPIRTSIWIKRRLNLAIEKSVKKLDKYAKDLNGGTRKSDFYVS